MRAVAGHLAAAALVLLIAALAAACGHRSEDLRPGEPQPLTLALDFYVNPDHAGIYEALERGYFEQAGLDVQPKVPSDPAAPIRQVASGQVDLAVSYEPEVVLARDQGLPVVAVGALVSRPLTSMIWLAKSGVRGIEDLAGGTVATAGIPYQTAFLEAILRRAGVAPADVRQVDVGLGLLPALLSGRADAMLGGFLNVEGVDLRRRGEHPTVLPVDRLGVPTYDELVIVASEQTVQSDPDIVRLFLGALERGTRDAAANPGRATDAVLEAGEGLEPELTAVEVRRTLPLLLPETGRRPYGYMDPGEWDRFARFMADQGLVEEAPPSPELLTNELLPGSQG